MVVRTDELALLHRKALAVPAAVGRSAASAVLPVGRTLAAIR